MAVKVKHHTGKWWVFIDHKGKRKAKCIGKSEKAAKEVAGKIEAVIFDPALDQFNVSVVTELFGHGPVVRRLWASAG